MLSSGLPQASIKIKSVRIGGTVVKIENPTQSTSDAKKGLDILEEAAKKNIFIENEPATK